MNFFANIPEAVSEIKKGKMLIIVDASNREDEGDFYIPAEKVTPQLINTMIKFGGGLICCAITKQQASRLKLPLMVKPSKNTEKTKVNFTISVNSKKGITTGVSAYDRAKTIKVITNPHSSSNDLARPGHVLGLIAKDGGILERAGHTEAAVDLAKLAQLSPAGVLCEIVGKDGKMAKPSELIRLARKLNVKIVSIADLIRFLGNR